MSKEIITDMLKKFRTPRDWKEDFKHENGNYGRTCMYCKEVFMGHKRRVFCKSCAETDSPKEKK